MKKVESIFDYDPTEQELRRFGLDRKTQGEHYDEGLALLKKVLSEVDEDDEPEYYYLGLLFSMRGDTKRAEEYFAKAPYNQQRLLVQDF
jgi:tetratricopeptide (TPR) repeat protein